MRSLRPQGIHWQQCLSTEQKESVNANILGQILSTLQAADLTQALGDLYVPVHFTILLVINRHLDCG